MPLPAPKPFTPNLSITHEPTSLRDPTRSVTEHGVDLPNVNQNLNHGQALKRRRSASPEGQRPAKQSKPLEARLTNPESGMSTNQSQSTQPAPGLSKAAQKKKNKEAKIKRLKQQQANLAKLRHAPGLEPRPPPGHVEGNIINPFLMFEWNQTPEIMRALGYTPPMDDSPYPPRPPPPIFGDPSMNWGQQTMGWPAQPLHLTYPPALTLPFQPPQPSEPPPPPPPPRGVAGEAPPG